MSLNSLTNLWPDDAEDADPRNPQMLHIIKTLFAITVEEKVITFRSVENILPVSLQCNQSNELLLLNF